MKKVVIIGARVDGHGKVLLETFRTAGTYEVVGFVDDNVKAGTSVCGTLVLGGTEILSSLVTQGISSVIIGIGDGQIRKQLTVKAVNTGFHLVNCIHPSSVIAAGSIVGSGVFIGPNAVVIAGSKIMDNVIVNTAATVDHDCVVEPCVSICPGVHLAGRVKVCEGAFIGTGAIVIPDVEIGAWSVVGAGATVIRDVQPCDSVMGVPARSKER